MAGCTLASHQLPLGNLDALGHPARRAGGKPLDKFASLAKASRATIQINIGTHQRNAHRDYNEVLAPQSVGLYLAATPQEKIDALTLNNATLFRPRFGFEAAKQTVRAQALDIRQRHEMTDREIRWLRYSGLLHVTRDEAKLVPDRRIPMAGWFQLALFSPLFVIRVFQIGFSDGAAWKLFLGQATVSALWFSITWGLSKLYIEPWRLLRKVWVLSN